MKTITFLFFLLSSLHLYSQRSFGIEFGKYYQNYVGVNEFDSIRVVTTHSDMGEAFFGIFYDLPIGNRFSLHNKLYFRPIYIASSVFNFEQQCTFCPVRKAGFTAITNISIELLPQFELVEISGAKLSVFGGINTSFNISKNDREIDFDGRHPGVALVMNSQDNVVDPLTFSWIYGASLQYWRFNLWAKVQHLSQFSSNISINGRQYDYINEWAFVSFSVGYRFYSLKLKNKGDRSLKR
jgi:hypothetical protein